MEKDQIKVLSFQEISDNRGKLVAIEGNKDIPFDIKRVFYIYGNDMVGIRGQHANKQSEFVLINVSGSSKIKVKDDLEEVVYELSRPFEGLYLPKLVWKEMYDFSSDSVLLVLASEKYDAAEYIKDFEEYLKIKREGKND